MTSDTHHRARADSSIELTHLEIAVPVSYSELASGIGACPAQVAPSTGKIVDEQSGRRV